MRILVISEGKHELNHVDGDNVSGALLHLIRRVLNPIPPESLHLEPCDIRSIGPTTKKDWGTGGPDYKKKAMSCIRIAQNKKFDALVLVVDQDKVHERHEGLDAAQADTRLSLPRAIGLAIKSFDA